MSFLKCQQDWKSGLLYPAEAFAFPFCKECFGRNHIIPQPSLKISAHRNHEPQSGSELMQTMLTEGSEEHVTRLTGMLGSAAPPVTILSLFAQCSGLGGCSKLYLKLTALQNPTVVRESKAVSPQEWSSAVDFSLRLYEFHFWPKVRWTTFPSAFSILSMTDWHVALWRA